MNRRAFLVGTGTAVALSSRAAQSASPSVAAGAPAADAWAKLKAEFELDPKLVHMSSFFLTSHPRPVREALEAHRRGLDANAFHYIEDNIVRLETDVRKAAAEYLQVEADDLALTDSTTQGLGLVYGGLQLREGDEILTTTHDHIVTHLSLQYRARRTGNPLRQVALYDAPPQADADAIAARFEKALGPKTRAVAVTWVHSGTGVKLPIQRLAAALARWNAGRAEADRALLFVDGVHGLGIEDETMASVGADVFIAGTHKWIFGPRGTGFVWSKRAAWTATAPIIPSFDPMWRTGPPQSIPPAAFMTPGGFHSFEHRWALGPAFRLHLGLGKAKVADRIHELNRWCKEELAKMPRVKVKTPAATTLSAGLICFEVDGLEPHAVVEKLRAQGVVASVTPGFYTPAYARLAPSLMTVEADVERTLAAVRAL
jgi:selenocysteine lyase/cysteine desulfurase